MRKLNEVRQISVQWAEDHRDHLIVYLFATLSPFYFSDLNSWRGLSANIVALGFVIFLFWHLNLHYMNLFFALRGYRVYTVYPDGKTSPLSQRGPFILITRSPAVEPGHRLVFRLSNDVYLEGD